MNKLLKNRHCEIKIVLSPILGSFISPYGCNRARQLPYKFFCSHFTMRFVESPAAGVKQGNRRAVLKPPRQSFGGWISFLVHSDFCRQHSSSFFPQWRVNTGQQDIGCNVRRPLCRVWKHLDCLSLRERREVPLGFVSQPSPGCLCLVAFLSPKGAGTRSPQPSSPFLLVSRSPE